MLGTCTSVELTAWCVDFPVTYYNGNSNELHVEHDRKQWLPCHPNTVLPKPIKGLLIHRTQKRKNPLARRRRELLAEALTKYFWTCSDKFAVFFLENCSQLWTMLLYSNTVVAFEWPEDEV